MTTPIKTGEKIPDVTLRAVTTDGVTEIQTADFFKGRKVVLFSVVGAFTGTCNNDHMPSYLSSLDEIKAKGVDEVACVAVNDPSVVGVWAESTGAAGKIAMLSDGNGDFADAVGMTLDGSKFGLGKRSLRYSMVVDDGTVTAMEVEENPGVCSVSGGTSILGSL